MKIFISIFGFSLLLGIFFASFVVDYGLGFGWTIFMLILAMGIFLSLPEKITNYPRKTYREGYFLLIAGCCLALSFSIRDQDHFDPLNVLLTFPLMVAGGYALHNHISHIPQKFFSFFFTGLGEYFRSCMSYLSSLFKIMPSFSQSKVSSDRWSRWTPQIGLSILVGLGIIGFIILPLLVSADPVFGKFINDVFLFDISFERFADIPFGKIICGAVISCLTGGAILLMRTPSGSNNLTPTLSSREGVEHHDFGNIQKQYYHIVVTMITLVYLAFAIVQIKYLFLGGTLPAGVTYSEYAVQGFWQLLAILSINVAVFLISPLASKEHRYGTILNAVLFVASGVIWVSCWMRLQMYIDVYQLTRMRLLPWTFSILLLALLILVYIGTQKSSLSRVSVCFYGVCLWYVLLNLVGVDMIIAKYNVSYTEASKLDYAYLLHELSNDVYIVLDKEKVVPFVKDVPILEWQEKNLSLLVNP